MKKRPLFGVIVSECNREYTSDMIKGIIGQSFLCGCDLLIMAAHNNFQQPLSAHKQYEFDIYRLAASKEFDGFIYDRNYIYNENIIRQADQLLKSTNKPVVTPDASGHPYFENILSHDFEAFGRLAEHLITVHGYKKIYCLTGKKGSVQAEERLRAYHEAMRKYRLYFDASYYSYGDFWKDAPAKFGKRILDHELEMPEAVMCANDIMAETLISVLRKGGLRVPEDIAVTGYDGDCLDPRNDGWLTTYKRNGFRLGAETVRRLFGTVTGKSCRRVRERPDDLIIGESCGCIGNSHRKSITRTQRMQKAYEEKFLHSNMLFDILQCGTIPELMIELSGYTHMLYCWSRFRIMLTEPYMRLSDSAGSLKFDDDLSVKEMLWCDAGRHDRLDTTAFPLRKLPGHLSDERFPTAYFLSPLHYEDHFFGIAALSFGKKALSYSDAYISYINYIGAALDQLLKKAQYGKVKDRSAFESAVLYESLCDVRKSMREHPESRWNIDLICDKVHVSRSYLQRMYKTYFGSSIFDELICFRMEKAKTLLAQTKSSVTKVAELCGYSSYNHFVRQFRETEKLTPTEYRRKWRKE